MPSGAAPDDGRMTVRSVDALHGLLLGGGRAATRWVRSIVTPLAERGIVIHEVPDHEDRSAIEAYADPRTRASLSSVPPDFVIADTGLALAMRPGVLRAMIAGARAEGAIPLVRWGDSERTLAKFFHRIPRHQQWRSRSLLRHPSLVHLGLTPHEAGGVSRVFGIPVERFRLVGNVREDRSDWREPPDDPPIVLSVAAVTLHKGADRFVEVARRVRGTHPDVRFVWVGNPSSNQWSQDLVTASDGVAEFVGWSDDPSPWYRRASVFLLPSRRDAAPGAAIEAMACGRRVVGFSGTGITDIVGRSGEIVDDEQGAAEAIVRAIDPPAPERVDMMSRARFEAENSPDVVGGRVADLLRGLTDEVTHPRRSPGVRKERLGDP